jgi:hypothetical protein
MNDIILYQLEKIKKNIEKGDNVSLEMAIYQVESLMVLMKD